MFFLDQSLVQALGEHERQDKLRLAQEYASKRDPDKECLKCGRDLVWVRMALVCVEHGYSGKGC